VLAVTALAGCGSAGSVPSGRRTPPDLAGFLRLPVATPSACPAGVAGSASGRRSPWAGHVDLSVFVDDRASAATVSDLGSRLRRTAGVRTVYFESGVQAVEEYRRLYTCSAALPRTALPASYRLVLSSMRHDRRDDLIRALRRLPGVSDVVCDPTDPCTDVR